MFDLRKKYFEIEEKLSGLCFEDFWPGFQKYEFALYNEEIVVLNGEMIAKTDIFLANTAILYEERYIAIWNLEEDWDTDLLTSKIVHEMFHAYQRECGENRYADEFTALLNYEYSAEYLNHRLWENRMLAEATEQDTEESLDSILSSRRLRKEKYPFQYDYEEKLEIIEGTATYVELKVLSVLNVEKFNDKIAQMIGNMRRIESLIPARVLTYDTGALMLLLCEKAGKEVSYQIEGNRDALFKELVEAADAEIVVGREEAVEAFLERDQKELKAYIENTVNNGKEVVRGDFGIVGINVYDARGMNGYITSRHFVAYEEDGKETVLYGNFVVKIEDYRIKEIIKDEKVQ